MEFFYAIIALVFWALCLGALIGLIYLWYRIAKSFQEAAEDKGYFSKKYLHLTFWLPPIGMILTAALPDIRSQSYLKKIAAQTSTAPAPAPKQVNSTQTVHNEQLPDI